MSRFSSTVMPGKIPRPSGAWQIPSSTRLCPGTPVMSSPANRICPAVTRRSPESVFRVVVLPAPLAPISVTISPSSTSIEIPRSASILP